MSVCFKLCTINGCFLDKIWMLVHRDCGYWQCALYMVHDFTHIRRKVDTKLTYRLVTYTMLLSIVGVPSHCMLDPSQHDMFLVLGEVSVFVDIIMFLFWRSHYVLVLMISLRFSSLDFITFLCLRSHYILVLLVVAVLVHHNIVFAMIMLCWNWW